MFKVEIKDKEKYEKAYHQLIEDVSKEEGAEFAHKVAALCRQDGQYKDAAGLPPEKIESIYKQAYLYYRTGKYAEGVQAFRMLSLWDSQEPKFTMGIAACLHMMKEYVAAIQMYMFTSTLDPTDPLPYLHSSDCYEQMDNLVMAAASLQKVLNLSDDPKYEHVKEQASLSLEKIKKDLGIKPN